jgi:monoamine oxidase
VNSINQYGDKVLVTTTSGQIYKASKIILANPTNTYEKISFSPPLPAVKRSIVSRSTAGTYAKVILTYAQPWWREAGLVGKFTSMKGPICFSWELCDPAADSWNLALFITGPVAKAWSKLPSDLAREDAVIEHLAHLAGSATGDSAIADKAKDVIEVHMVDWNKEEWLWGAPTSYMGPNTLRQYGTTMRNPFKNVHFAGGEYAFEWKGYLEGAVRSGQRAAKEVLDAIKY